MELIKKYKSMSLALKAGLWFTVCNFIQKGISFITIPIFTRIMTQEEYGAYSIYSSWYGIITIFATLHLSYYVFNKGLVKFEDDRDTFAVSMQSLSAVLTLAIIALYLLLRVPINRLIRMNTPMVLCMLCQILFEPPVLYWTARNRFEYRYQFVLFATLGIAAANPLVGILLIKSGVFADGALARVFSIAAVSALFGIPIAVLLIRKARVPFSVRYWKYALNFNLPLVPHYLSQTVLSQADRIMIDDLCGKTDAAIYSLAYSIGMVCTLFSQAIQQAFLPWLYKKMKKKDYAGIPRISTAFLCGILGILIVILCFAPEILAVAGPASYRSAVWAIPPICASIFFIFLQELFANIEYYFEKTRLIAAASVVVSVLNVILNAIFIRKYGFVAAGYTTLVCYLLYSVTHFFVMRSVCRKNGIPLGSLFDLRVVLALSGVMLGVVFLMVWIYRFSFWVRYAIILAVLIACVIFRRRIRDLIVMMKGRKEDEN